MAVCGWQSLMGKAWDESEVWVAVKYRQFLDICNHFSDLLVWTNDKTAYRKDLTKNGPKYVLELSLSKRISLTVVSVSGNEMST